MNDQRYKTLTSYVEAPLLFLDENKAIEYLKRLLNSFKLNDCNYCEINYELLIALKCHYYNRDAIQKLIVELDVKIYSNYLLKQQYLKRLL